MRLELLRKYLTDHDIPFSDEQESKFVEFSTLLSERNKVMNLTAVSEGKNTEIRHFIDSLALIAETTGFNVIQNTLQNARIIDLGTGAGFPGIPLAIMLPQAHFTLVDSLQKRISFLNEVVAALNLKNVNLVCGRFEELARNNLYRETFDFGVSRAVAEMRVLLEYSLPFIKKDGIFAAYKSGNAIAEIDQAAKALFELNSSVESVWSYSEYGSDLARSLVFVKKNASVSDRYPRRNGIPSKRPL